MGFTVYYRSMLPIDPETAATVKRRALELCQDRSWLGCEPVGFYPDGDDGHLFGGSKPNFLPDHHDAESAEASGLPDGTVRDMLDVLARLSRDHRVDWEIRHDHSDQPSGLIRAGVCDEGLLADIEAIAGLADTLSAEIEGLGAELEGWDEEGTLP